MNYPDNIVSVHPYFKVHAGKLAEFKAILPEMIAKVAAEPGTRCYEIAAHGDEYLFREAYVGAAGWQAHMINTDALVARLLKVATVTRLEIHGKAEELDKLRVQVAAMNPVWYVRETGVWK